MRNYSLLILSIIFIITSASAQKIRSGIKGGFNYSSLYIDDVEDRKIRPGFHVGFFGQSALGEATAIQTELLYTTAGNKSTYNVAGLNGEIDFNLNYIQLPVMLNLKIAGILEVHGGIYAAYLIGANSKSDGNFGSGYQELNRDGFKDLDFGLAAGAGVNFGDLQVGLRYNLGLTEVADSNSARSRIGSSKNVVGQFYLALGL